MDEFNATLDLLKTYAATLTAEELIVADMVDFEYDKYTNQFKYTGIDARALEHVHGLLDGTRDEVDAYRAQKVRVAKGITVPKLLGRYERLPAQWRTYVRINGIEADEDDTDEKVFTTMSTIKPTELNDKSVVTVLTNMARALDEAEAEVALLEKK